MEKKHFDTFVIGFGKAGKTLAGALAKSGREIALAEQSSQMYGGTCINVGCIPSKSLVTSASHASLHASDSFEQKAKRYAEAIAEKRRVTSFLRDKNYHKLADLPNVTIFDGIASFAAAHEIQITAVDGTSELVSADRILINTGAVPVTPNISGLKDNPNVYTSETLMEQDRLPAHLILIGAGYIGMEFASLYNAFGSQVTVIQDSGEFLPREDRDVAEAIHDILEKRGVKFILNAQVTSVDGGKVTYVTAGQATSEGNVLEADAILVATGRRANTDLLQAENAGITLTSRGAVQVDEHLRTNVPDIWAAGDVAGGLQFTYISLDDYRIILSQITGNGERSTADRPDVPYSVFMDTPLSRVGLTEKQAADQELPFRIVKLPTAAVPKAQVLRKTDGFLKVLINTQNDQILGASLLCPESYEMINLLKLAMDLNAPYTTLRDRIYTHPTMTEAFNDLFSL